MEVVFRVKEVTMFCILLFLLSFSSSIESSSLELIDKINLPNGAMGAESLAFNLFFLHTGVADGRILKYGGPALGFQDSAHSTPNRSKAVCDGYDGNINPILGPKCGRPLGIGFNSKTGELYIADAYCGFLVVRKNETFAQIIATSAEGVPFHLLDGLDVDQLTGFVYFTDASARFGLSEIALAIAANDSTGRLLKYDPQTRNVTVLLTGLSGPAGVAVSRNGRFLLVTEFIAKRIQIYYLAGPKANTAEIALDLPGSPDNIKSTASPDVFWVAINELVLPSLAYKITTGNGTKVLEKFSLPEYTFNQASEVHQVGNDTLYIGSMTAPYIYRYRIKP